MKSVTKKVITYVCLDKRKVCILCLSKKENGEQTTEETQVKVKKKYIYIYFAKFLGGSDHLEIIIC